MRLPITPPNRPTIGSSRSSQGTSLTTMPLPTLMASLLSFSFAPLEFCEIIYLSERRLEFQEACRVDAVIKHLNTFRVTELSVEYTKQSD
ncbi:hypothetical protein MUK42_28707 [Musa troglodytarum]|uniref:Uncharacterized protein n=1 Tax=Musa troglodytarum TaxID=320322 RepID=A0A9E7GB26_9LILI|nr:hypothetical protein MUK42_28707 [Musa troglodytarum]